MKYLLDTNVLVAMFRKQHNVREQILSKGIRNCAVSIVTIAELKVGAYKTNDYRQWKEAFETQNSFNNPRPHKKLYFKSAHHHYSPNDRNDRMHLYDIANSLGHIHDASDLDRNAHESHNHYCCYYYSTN